MITARDISTTLVGLLEPMGDGARSRDVTGADKTRRGACLLASNNARPARRPAP
jgi:hypothetical protein